MLMNLGGFTFLAGGTAFETLKRKTQARWRGVERIGNSISFQHMGPCENTFTIEGTVWPSNGVGSYGDVAALHAMVGAMPNMLVSGYGAVFGRYNLVSVEDTQSYAEADGFPRRSKFTGELKTYHGARPLGRACSHRPLRPDGSVHRGSDAPRCRSGDGLGPRR
jgi:hypothetical protein